MNHSSSSMDDTTPRTPPTTPLTVPVTQNADNTIPISNTLGVDAVNRYITANLPFRQTRLVSRSEGITMATAMCLEEIEKKMTKTDPKYAAVFEAGHAVATVPDERLLKIRCRRYASSDLMDHLSRNPPFVQTRELMPDVKKDNGLAGRLSAEQAFCKFMKLRVLQDGYFFNQRAHQFRPTKAAKSSQRGFNILEPLLDAMDLNVDAPCGFFPFAMGLVALRPDLALNDPYSVFQSKRAKTTERKGLEPETLSKARVKEILDVLSPGLWKKAQSVIDTTTTTAFKEAIQKGTLRDWNSPSSATFKIQLPKEEKMKEYTLRKKDEIYNEETDQANADVIFSNLDFTRFHFQRAPYLNRSQILCLKEATDRVVAQYDVKMDLKRLEKISEELGKLGKASLKWLVSQHPKADATSGRKVTVELPYDIASKMWDSHGRINQETAQLAYNHAVKFASGAGRRPERTEDLSTEIASDPFFGKEQMIKQKLELPNTFDTLPSTFSDIIPDKTPLIEVKEATAPNHAKEFEDIAVLLENTHLTKDKEIPIVLDLNSDSKTDLKEAKEVKEVAVLPDNEADTMLIEAVSSERAKPETSQLHYRGIIEKYFHDLPLAQMMKVDYPPALALILQIMTKQRSFILSLSDPLRRNIHDHSWTPINMDLMGTDFLKSSMTQQINWLKEEVADEERRPLYEYEEVYLLGDLLSLSALRHNGPDMLLKKMLIALKQNKGTGKKLESTLFMREAVCRDKDVKDGKSCPFCQDIIKKIFSVYNKLDVKSQALAIDAVILLRVPFKYITQEARAIIEQPRVKDTKCARGQLTDRVFRISKCHYALNTKSELIQAAIAFCILKSSAQPKMAEITRAVKDRILAGPVIGEESKMMTSYFSVKKLEAFVDRLHAREINARLTGQLVFQLDTSQPIFTPIEIALGCTISRFYLAFMTRIIKTYTLAILHDCWEKATGAREDELYVKGKKNDSCDLFDPNNKEVAANVAKLFAGSPSLASVFKQVDGAKMQFNGFLRQLEKEKKTEEVYAKTGLFDNASSSSFSSSSSSSSSSSTAPEPRKSVRQPRKLQTLLFNLFVQSRRAIAKSPCKNYEQGVAASICDFLSDIGEGLRKERFAQYETDISKLITAVLSRCETLTDKMNYNLAYSFEVTKMTHAFHLALPVSLPYLAKSILNLYHRSPQMSARMYHQFCIEQPKSSEMQKLVRMIIASEPFTTSCTFMGHEKSQRNIFRIVKNLEMVANQEAYNIINAIRNQEFVASLL